MYAYFKVGSFCRRSLPNNVILTCYNPQKLDYHSTECIYSPTAYRGHARALVKDLEAIRPSSILDIIYSGEAMAGMVKTDVRRPVQGEDSGRRIRHIHSHMANFEKQQVNARDVARCQVKNCVKLVHC